MEIKYSEHYYKQVINTSTRNIKAELESLKYFHDDLDIAIVKRNVESLIEQYIEALQTLDTF